MNYGVHPDQAPTLDHNATDAEIDAFKQIIYDWNYSVKDHKDLILNIMSHETIDEEPQLWHLAL